MFELNQLTYRYENSNSIAINKLNINIPIGSITSIVGPSGSGKTTLIKLLSGVLTPTEGSIELSRDGMILNSSTSTSLDWIRQFGYVNQLGSLLPHLDVYNNILLPLRVRKLLNKSNKSNYRTKVIELLNSVGLNESYLNRYPSELSGGQQQRVAIVRALITSSKFLLLDEPFSALDPGTRALLENMLMYIKTKLNLTIVMVTHDIDNALNVSNKLIVLERGQVIQEGNVNQILSEPCEFIRNSIELYDHIIPTVNKNCSRRRALTKCNAHGVEGVNVYDDIHRIAYYVSKVDIEDSINNEPNDEVTVWELGQRSCK